MNCWHVGIYFNIILKAYCEDTLKNKVLKTRQVIVLFIYLDVFPQTHAESNKYIHIYTFCNEASK